MDTELDNLIDSALNTAVRTDGPVKLFHGKYDTNGLFDKNATGRKAANHGFGTAPPLWSEEARSSLNHTLFVRLQPGGLERLLSNTPSEDRVELINSASDLYQRDLLERWSDLATANGWEEDAPLIAECCARLIRNIYRSVPHGAVVETPASADFKRRMAHELVIAWKFAPTPEAKQSIANALRNSGIKQIGEPEERVTMDGGLHRCEGPAFPGDPVEIVESGWVVHDGVGEYLLEKAIVKMI